MGSRWTTVNQAAKRLRISRWDVLMQCLHKRLMYRPTASGVEVSEHSVRAVELELAQVDIEEVLAGEPAA